MPVIKPISDLRNNFAAISAECHEKGEPVFLTKNGQGDLVVMSIEEYEKIQGRLELYAKLEEAEAESRNDADSLSHAEMMVRMRESLNAR
ncbi:MAG: type II toxin-antitoxin system Phd/YefM family antitoxin [Spirochaetia bacterium]|nr:type II toxin-antitoxin system Phd/YefM family antitoxin [Spirochaetales bacterium]